MSSSYKEEKATYARTCKHCGSTRTPLVKTAYYRGDVISSDVYCDACGKNMDSLKIENKLLIVVVILVAIILLSSDW